MDACLPPLISEYQSIMSTVTSYDSMLLTVKGWSVTLSLLLLAKAFEVKSRDVLLLAAVSSLCFWLLDAGMKGHQRRYYPRMRHIEVMCSMEGKAGPLVDWSWERAESEYLDQESAVTTKPKYFKNQLHSYWKRFFYPVVMLPHILPLLAGALLAFLAHTGRLWRAPVYTELS